METIKEAIEKSKIPKNTLLVLAKVMDDETSQLDLQSGENKKHQFSKSELIELLSLVAKKQREADKEASIDNLWVITKIERTPLVTDNLKQ